MGAAPAPKPTSHLYDVVISHDIGHGLVPVWRVRPLLDSGLLPPGQPALVFTEQRAQDTRPSRIAFDITTMGPSLPACQGDAVPAHVTLTVQDARVAETDDDGEPAPLHLAGGTVVAPAESDEQPSRTLHRDVCLPAGRGTRAMVPFGHFGWIEDARYVFSIGLAHVRHLPTRERGGSVPGFRPGGGSLTLAPSAQPHIHMDIIPPLMLDTPAASAALFAPAGTVAHAMDALLPQEHRPLVRLESRSPPTAAQPFDVWRFTAQLPRHSLGAGRIAGAEVTARALGNCGNQQVLAWRLAAKGHERDGGRSLNQALLATSAEARHLAVGSVFHHHEAGAVATQSLNAATHTTGTATLCLADGAAAMMTFPSAFAGGADVVIMQAPFKTGQGRKDLERRQRD
ncbi:hypothetical protein E3E12_04195 [Formicincola oecophyllae]|uniref:Uncharacterized protein n=1 Tax=Formicincola oecophyllae TaxID=2558361 RepID=A0A4Y6UAP8_9PROT|nr:hypothetical protein [Formicincola oecophyllae]QDH13527.1 hypothetical protein E3E12_04195 [Formicincola oecophyllae]